MEWTSYDKQFLPPVLLGILFLSCLLGILLRRRSPRVRAIPTALIALVLLFLEVIKQRWNILGEFDYYLLPFHYCSLFLPVLTLGELCGERLSRIFRPIGTCMAFVVSVAMYISPDGILGNATQYFGVGFRATHTILFHHLVVLYLFLVIALRLYRPRLRDALSVAALGAVYVAIALPLSYRFDTNYCNFLFSEIPPMESLRLAAGQGIYTALMTVFLTLGIAIGALLYLALYRATASLFRAVRRMACRASGAEK